jgi:hypothetical protein
MHSRLLRAGQWWSNGKWPRASYRRWGSRLSGHHLAGKIKLSIDRVFALFSDRAAFSNRKQGL